MRIRGSREQAVWPLLVRIETRLWPRQKWINHMLKGQGQSKFFVDWHVYNMFTICLQYIYDMFTICLRYERFQRRKARAFSFADWHVFNMLQKGDRCTVAFAD